MRADEQHRERDTHKRITAPQPCLHGTFYQACAVQHLARVAILNPARGNLPSYEHIRNTWGVRIDLAVILLDSTIDEG